MAIWWTGDEPPRPYEVPTGWGPCEVCGTLTEIEGDHRTLCHWCVRAGYDSRACGCLVVHQRVVDPCSTDHAPCETCLDQPRQHGDTLCGDCRFEAEQRAHPVSHEIGVRR
jgi:hypothetical protein